MVESNDRTDKSLSNFWNFFFVHEVGNVIDSDRQYIQWLTKYLHYSSATRGTPVGWIVLKANWVEITWMFYTRSNSSLFSINYFLELSWIFSYFCKLNAPKRRRDSLLYFRIFIVKSADRLMRVYLLSF